MLLDPSCHTGNAIQDLKSALYALKEKVDLKVLEERKAVIAAVDEVAAKVTQMPEFKDLDADKQARITGRLEREKAGLDKVALIPVLQNKANHVSRRSNRGLRLFPVLQVVYAVGRQVVARDATTSSGGRAAVRRLRRAHD